MTRQIIFPGGLIAQARMLQRTKTHLFPNTGLAAIITDFLGEAITFADLRLPFAAVAMDIATARPHVIRDGPLLPALLASAGIPGIFAPVEHGPLRLYDGGIVANVPMRQAVAMGARSLLPRHPERRRARALRRGLTLSNGRSRWRLPCSRTSMPVKKSPHC